MMMNLNLNVKDHKEDFNRKYDELRLGFETPRGDSREYNFFQDYVEDSDAYYDFIYERVHSIVGSIVDKEFDEYYKSENYRDRFFDKSFADIYKAISEEVEKQYQEWKRRSF